MFTPRPPLGSVPVVGIESSELCMGDAAPDFEVEDVDGEELRLFDELRNGRVVLAFFHKAFTIGCRFELMSYQRRYADFQGLGAEVIAISADPVERLREFRQYLKARFRFVSDPQRGISDLYKARVVVGRKARRTFVVEVNKQIIHVETGFRAIYPGGAYEACDQEPPG